MKVWLYKATDVAASGEPRPDAEATQAFAVDDGILCRSAFTRGGRSAAWIPNVQHVEAGDIVHLFFRQKRDGGAAVRLLGSFRVLDPGAARLNEDSDLAIVQDKALDDKALEARLRKEYGVPEGEPVTGWLLAPATDVFAPAQDEPEIADFLARRATLVEYRGRLGLSPPTALGVSRYRAFAGDEVLPLRPLTLLYGRNNAGKSALARMLGILGASVVDRAPSPLVFPRGDRDVDLTEMAWQGEPGDYSMSLSLRWGDGEVREARYVFDREPNRTTYIREIELKDGAGVVVWSGSPQQASELLFDGLVPRRHEASAVRALAERMISLRGRVRWLDGVRARPPQGNIQRKSSLEHACDGADAYARLIERPELVGEVNRFYADLDPPRDLEVKEELDAGFRIRLNPRSRPSFRIDLHDTGEGMVQVLPVLVAATQAAREGTGTILAVEEPESHLHPDAQGVLARFLCGIAAGEKPPTFVLETHSRVFLLAVQLEVAAGRLPPERVGLAWVDQDAQGRSQVTPVELSPSGHPREGWPQAALGEDLRIAGELARLTLKGKS